MTETGGEGSTDHPEDLARTAMESSNLHGFLAAVFRAEVTPEFLQDLRSAAVVEALADVGVEMTDQFLNGPEDEVVEQLAVEYAALYLGPGKHISPHESIYRVDEEREAELMGACTVAVKKYIEAVGFEYDEKYMGIPDHICVELEFMSELASRENKAWEKDDPVAAANALEFQQEFMGDHLSLWVPKFCGKVVEMCDDPFYKGIAQLTMAFLDSEKEDIDRRLAIGQARSG